VQEADSRNSKKRSQRIERTTGKIDDLLNAKDELQTAGDKKQNRGLEETG